MSQQCRTLGCLLAAACTGHRRAGAAAELKGSPFIEQPGSIVMSQAKPKRAARSIEVDGVTHGAAPIPMGARVGNMLFSSGIMGKDPTTDTLPADAAKQAKFLFQNMRSLLRNGGATVDDVVRVTAYVVNDSVREPLNAEWLQCFPDPHDRPARHVIVKDLPGGMLLQIEIMAVVES
jgi:2-iminobutanoate/2-iminopropanoate deaminase